MTISIKKYININSSVGAGNAVPTAELIGRLFTTNPLLPTNSFLEFTSPLDVGSYFGTDSEEYARAVQYFTFINKTGATANKISYARWNEAAVAPTIYGGRLTTTLTQFTAIADGSLTMTIGGVTNTMAGIDLTTATSLADVATALQAAINDNTGTQWTAATVSYSGTRAAFDFVGGDTGVADISVSATGSGTDLQDLIVWNALGIFSDGAAAQSITDLLTDSADQSNNFGSFIFMPTLTIDLHVEAATWNYAQNVQFQYYIPVLIEDYADWKAALINIGMCALILTGVADEYPEMGPMETMASTDYSLSNTVQNYEFQDYNLTATVTTTALSNTLDAARVNYNGATQTAGVKRTFFQTGILMGPANSPQYMNIAANEQWLKAAMTSELMSLLLVLTRIPANAQGIAQILTTMQGVIQQALLNGTISVGKPLTSAQKSLILSLTGDPLAYLQIQNSGWRAGCTVDAVAGVATYSLIYSKDDVIRKITGNQILI